MKKNPIDEALTDIMDAWMDMMNKTGGWYEGRPRAFSGIQVPSMREEKDIGDWEDNKHNITLTIDMPGVQKKDIDLNVSAFKVSVTAETEGRDYSFEKRFDTMLNPDEVTANLNNGVLDIKIQKDKSLDGKKITIK